MTKDSNRHHPRWGVLAVATAIAATAVLAACAPPATGGNTAPTPTTLPPGAVQVSYICQGVGFASGPALPAQDIGIAVTAPASVAPGEVFDLTVDMSPIALSASPVDLNSYGLAGVVALSTTGATAGSGAVGAPVYFEGATALVPTATAALTTTASSGGTVDVELGQISIVTGSTGYVCTVEGGATPASASIPVL